MEEVDESFNECKACGATKGGTRADANLRENLENLASPGDCPRPTREKAGPVNKCNPLCDLQEK